MRENTEIQHMNYRGSIENGGVGDKNFPEGQKKNSN